MGRKKTVFNNVSVTEENLHTMNHCVNTCQFLNGKPFMFKIDNENYLMTPENVLSYIGKNPRCKIWKHGEKVDSDGNIRKYHIPIFLIPDEYIINNSKHIKG